MHKVYRNVLPIFCLFAVSFLLVSCSGKNIRNDKYAYSFKLDDGWGRLIRSADAAMAISSITNMQPAGVLPVSSTLEIQYFGKSENQQDRLAVIVMELAENSKNTTVHEVMANLISLANEGVSFQTINGVEFLTIVGVQDGISWISSYAVCHGLLYAFVGVTTGGDNVSIITSVLNTVKIKRYGFFKGIWHGVRTPFIFVHNLFAKNDIAIFSSQKTGWYTVGYLLGILFILSSIFGGGSLRK
ncbi:MAG: hypothetical protein LBJ31_07980 [Treponema sp.]|jgi:hypothetical protein|nr:hypothetical protein [Treponema sp.]